MEGGTLKAEGIRKATDKSGMVSPTHNKSDEILNSTILGKKNALLNSFPKQHFWFGAKI